MSDVEMGLPLTGDVGPTDQTTGRYVEEPEPWDGADGLPLSGEYGQSTATRVRHDHLESARNFGGGGAYRPPGAPVAAREDPPDVLGCYTRSGALNERVRLVEANPRRMTVKVAIIEPDTVVRVAGSEAASQSPSMSWTLTSTTPLELDYQGALWVFFYEAGTVTAAETLQSGLADGMAIDHGGS